MESHDALITREYEMLHSCLLCGRQCGINRMNGKTGWCRAGREIEIYRAHPHSGEEPPISGTRGSGTIFFTHCSLCCIYCQNYKFSQQGRGSIVSPEALCRIMLRLQEEGCHNVNLVTPTHYIPSIIHALVLAKEQGLSIPVVYNTSAYESVDALKLLHGLVDIYLADMRYGRNDVAQRCSSVCDYVQYNRAAIKEMYRQVGGLKLDEAGLAVRGLIVRHLVLPDGLAGTEEVMRFIADEISPATVMSLMRQYRPLYQAQREPSLYRAITPEEYDDALTIMTSYGLSNGWVQEAPADEEEDEVLLGTKLEQNMSEELARILHEQ